MPSTKKRSKNSHYEFNGPIGVVGIMIGLPLATYLFFLFCNSHQCLGNPFEFSYSTIHLPSFQDLFQWQAFVVYFSWIFFQALLHVLLPGREVQGVPLENGTRLKYKINAFAAGIVSTVLVLGGTAFGVLPLAWIYENFLALLTAANVFATLLSIYLYVSSRRPGAMLSKPGNTGNVIYDFFMGHELNPRLFGFFDLKYFCELRPGLIGWMLIDFAMMVKQYQLHHYVTNSMVLVCLFQALYVFDALYNESAILTTMDITTDGFGFMLAFGDLVWVPFVYSLQARYLVDYENNLDHVNLVLIITLKLVGLWIFRGANGQKDTFRTNPNSSSVKHLKFIKTQQGNKLLVEGWWGMARHINYFGDMLMGLAWCLPCGTKHLLPYFYSIYFTILLIHRELRDEHKNQLKYGEDWEKYCKKVKWRIIPYVY